MTHCITNDVFELRPCIVAGEHRSICDGRARRREIVERYDRDEQRTFRAHLTRVLEDPCPGCLPRPAVDGGHVCDVHARKIADGIRWLPDLMTHLWSLHGPAPQGEDVSRTSGFGSSWNLDESTIVADELATRAVNLALAVLVEQPGSVIPSTGVLSSLGVHSDASVHQVAASARDLADRLAAAGGAVWERRGPARRAIEFAQAAHRAFLRFPTEDTPHRIPYLRCRVCDRMTLEWHPPLYYRDDDAISCENCGAVEDRTLYEHDVAVILAARGRRTR